MLAQLSSGHIDLADVCFLVAAIVAGIAELLSILKRPSPVDLIPIVLGLIALALFVL